MAIIKSMGVGKSSGSMGNITYRTVRGRTIGSQKIVKGGSGSISTRATSSVQKDQQILFGLMIRFASIYKADIVSSFDKSAYGSEVNRFIKLNSGVLKKAFASLVTTFKTSGATTVTATADQLNGAIKTYFTTNPSAVMFRSYKNGVISYVTKDGWIATSNDPTDPTA